MSSEKSDATEAPEAAARVESGWRRHGRALWLEWIKPLFIIGLVMFSFRSAVADWNDVPTGSMKPTILVGDRIFVNKLAYDLKIPFTRTSVATWSGPARGDIVTCWSPADGGGGCIKPRHRSRSRHRPSRRSSRSPGSIWTRKW